MSFPRKNVKAACGKKATMSKTPTNHNRIVLPRLEQVLADYLGDEIRGVLPGMFVPNLMERWAVHLESTRSLIAAGGGDVAGDDDRKWQSLRVSMLPLLECIACNAVAIGSNYQPWAVMTFDRALVGTEQHILRVSTLMAGDDASSGRCRYDDEEDSDIIICNLDVLDGLVCGMGTNFGPMLEHCERRSQFLGMVHTCCNFPIPGVRMSALALVGDLARLCPSVIEPAFQEFIGVVIMNLEGKGVVGRSPKAVNNALWSCGELCLRCQGNPSMLESVRPSLISTIVPYIVTGQAGFLENASATLGRLAMVDGRGFRVHEAVGPNVADWLGGVGKVGDRGEKKDGMMGLCLAVKGFPEMVMGEGWRRSSVSAFFMAVASFHIPLGDEDTFYPLESDLLFDNNYPLQDFPRDMNDLQGLVYNLAREIVAGLPGGQGEWQVILGALPLNVRRLVSKLYIQ